MHRELDQVFAPLNHIAYYHCRELSGIVGMPQDEIAWLTTLIVSFLVNLGMSHVKSGP